MRLPEVGSDIAQAETLPGWFYRSPEVLSAVRERVFARAHHLYAVASPSDPAVIPLELLPGLLGEPLVETRRGERRCLLSNVCTHRGALLVTEPHYRGTIRCPYHGRVFQLDGRLQRAPEFEAALDFPRESDHLRQVERNAWGPLCFASLDPARPFQQWFEPLRELFGFFEFEGCETRLREYEIEASWMLYCDNYLEGFHIPFVHPALAKEVEWGSYETELFANGSLQIALAREGAAALDLPAGHAHHGKRVAALYAFLFPSTIVNAYPWGLSINVLEPRDVERTVVRYITVVKHPEKCDVGAVSDLDGV